MRVVRAGCVGVVLFAVVCACGGSSPPAGRGNADGGGEPSQASADGGSGGDAGHPCADVQSDPYNCGACGAICSFANANALCVSGSCSRGTCAAGWYDLDGDPGNGCEASCSGATCTVGPGSTGRTVTLAAPPVPETGPVAGALASSGPAIADANDPPPVDLTGILGEATPLPYHDGDPANPTAAYVENGNSLVENLVGYQAVLH